MGDDAFDNLDKAQAHASQQLWAKAKEIQKKRGLDWHASWNAAIDENPEIVNGWTKFLFVPQDDGTISVVPPRQMATVDSARARAAACDAEARKIQASNPHLTFDESWQIARAKHAELFSGEKSAASWSDIGSKAEELLAKIDRLKAGAVRVVGIRQEI